MKTRAAGAFLAMLTILLSSFGARGNEDISTEARRAAGFSKAVLRLIVDLDQETQKVGLLLWREHAGEFLSELTIEDREPVCYVFVRYEQKFVWPDVFQPIICWYKGFCRGKLPDRCLYHKQRNLGIGE